MAPQPALRTGASLGTVGVLLDGAALEAEDELALTDAEGAVLEGAPLGDAAVLLGTAVLTAVPLLLGAALLLAAVLLLVAAVLAGGALLLGVGAWLAAAVLPGAAVLLGVAVLLLGSGRAELLAVVLAATTGGPLALALALGSPSCELTELQPRATSPMNALCGPTLTRMR